MLDFYNELAKHYDKWVSNDAQADELTRFYCEYLKNVSKDTKLVYLGIATGRIALAIVKETSLDIIGVDISKQMLDVCKHTFISEKLDSRLTLVEQNILELDIAPSKNIFILPFRTLVHFINLEDKKACLEAVYKQMKAEEVFIFDLSIFDEDEAQKSDGQPSLSYYDKNSGEVFYNQFAYDFDKQVVDVTVYKAIMKDEKLEGLSQHKYQSSWISPEDIRDIIVSLGFCILDYVGENNHQIWILEK